MNPYVAGLISITPARELCNQTSGDFPVTLSRWLSALSASGSVNTDFSKDCVAALLDISFAAVASAVAEDRVAALWSEVGELRIRLVGAGSSLDAHLCCIGVTKVAGAADEAREAVGIGGALRSGGGSEGHGGSHDGSRLEEKAEHFGRLQEQSGVVLKMLDALLTSVRMIVDNFHSIRDMRRYLYMKLPGMCFLNMAC